MEEVLCKCNQKALLQTVKKEGTNKGRNFYTCGTRTCHFFVWQDQKPNPNQFYNNKSTQNKNSDQPNIVPKCPVHNCPCIRKIVSSAISSNRGKYYYTCPNSSKEKKCFFLWENEFFPDDSNSCKSTDVGFKYVVTFQIVTDDLIHVSFSNELVEKMKELKKDFTKIDFGKRNETNLDKNYESFTFPLVNKGELISKIESFEMGVKINDIPDTVTRMLRDYPKIDVFEQNSGKIFLN